MDSLLFIFIILAIAAGLLVGAIIGFLVGSRRGRQTEAEQPAEPEEERPGFMGQAPEAPLTPPAALTNRTRTDFSPVVCLWRSRETGMLATEIKGKLYLNTDSFSPEAQKTLHDLSQEWAGWMGVSPLSPVAALRAELPEEEWHSETPAESPPAGPSRTLPREEGGEKPTPGGEMSIVEQIDEILHDMLLDASLENLSIRLQEDSSGGVVVWVGLTRYASIDDVQDPQAKQIIRAAVAEWERRSREKRQ